MEILSDNYEADLSGHQIMCNDTSNRTCAGNYQGCIYLKAIEVCLGKMTCQYCPVYHFLFTVL